MERGGGEGESGEEVIGRKGEAERKRKRKEMEVGEDTEEPVVTENSAQHTPQVSSRIEQVFPLTLYPR